MLVNSCAPAGRIPSDDASLTPKLLQAKMDYYTKEILLKHPDELSVFVVLFRRHHAADPAELLTSAGATIIRCWGNAYEVVVRGKDIADIVEKGGVRDLYFICFQKYVHRLSDPSHYVILSTMDKRSFDRKGIIVLNTSRICGFRELRKIKKSGFAIESVSGRRIVATGRILNVSRILDLSFISEVTVMCDDSCSEHTYKEGELLVKFREGVSEEDIKKLIEGMNAVVIKKFARLRTYLIKLPSGMSVSEGVKVFTELKEVEYAEPNYIRRTFDRD